MARDTRIPWPPTSPFNSVSASVSLPASLAAAARRAGSPAAPFALLGGFALLARGAAGGPPSWQLAHRRAVAAESEYRQIFDHAHDPILIFEPETERVLEVEPPRLRGVRLQRRGIPQDLAVRPARSNPRPAAARRWPKPWRSAASSISRPGRYRADGTLMYLEINASVIEFQGKKAILSINRDITERKRVRGAAARQGGGGTGQPAPKASSWPT